MQLQSSQQAIEEKLEALFTAQTTPYDELFDAARYALFSGGKRLRPRLTLATCQLLGGDLEQALIPACAIEIIHTYSMIHDDLPCMDDDDYRRGKPTLHRVVPEGLAVLTGDYLLTFAFHILATASGLQADQRIELIALIAKAAGSHGMVGGQVLDLAHEGTGCTEGTLMMIHRLKTGALIDAAVGCGAIIGNANSRQNAQLQAFSQCIGLAYQIVDDIIDVTQSEAKHGKATSSDVVSGKSTYVSCLGMETAQRRAEELYRRAMEHLDTFSGDREPLRALADGMIHRMR